VDLHTNSQETRIKNELKDNIINDNKVRWKKVKSKI